MSARPVVALSWEQHAGARALAISCSGDPSGLLEHELAVLPASLGSAVPRHLQPMAGEFEFRTDSLAFVPTHPFLPGRAYAVALVTPSGYEALATIEVPEPARDEPPRVLGIHPSANTVPLNLLRIYVEFSNSIAEGQATRTIAMRDVATHEPVPDVFLPHSLELWDLSRTRLTLLLDPGRIKRGLLPHELMGYPLREGAAVELVVSAELRDASGATLGEAVAQRYDVTPPLRRRVSIDEWQLSAPAVGSTDPVRVTFDRPMDYAMLHHALRVQDSSGEYVDGEATVGRGEREWSFRPTEAWGAHDYALVVDPLLEDLAGNSLRRVFDRDLESVEDVPPTVPVTTRRFSPVAQRVVRDSVR